MSDTLELDAPPEEQAAPAPSAPRDAIAVLRRGLRESRELRAGFGYTVALGVAMTAGRVVVPVLMQQILDRGLSGPSGFRPGLVYTESGGAHANRDWQRSVRDREWKLVWTRDPYEQRQFHLAPFSLFDIAHDRGETINLCDEQPGGHAPD